MSHVIIYLDESGCLGFTNPSSSKYFVITLLMVNDLKTQRSLFTAVKKALKNKISSKERKITYELKGSKTDLSIKKYFYKHMPKKGWRLYSIILDKDHTYPHLQTIEGKKRLYNYLAKCLLTNVKWGEDITRLDLYIDKCKSTKEIKEFNTYIEAHLNLPLKTILNINHVTSHENLAIQAVDLFCWGIFRKYTLKETDWYECFKENIFYEEVYKPD